LVGRYAELAACLGDNDVQRLSTEASGGGPEAGSAKRSVARAIVALYHGDDAAGTAESAFDRQFKQHQIPDKIPESELPADSVSGDAVVLPVALAELGLASSRGDARRLLSGGGVRIDGDQVTDEEVPLERLRGAVLQVGKRRFVRIRVD
jgi:tyrosyl-tRNA synthetase